MSTQLEEVIVDANISQLQQILPNLDYDLFQFSRSRQKICLTYLASRLRMRTSCSAAGFPIHIMPQNGVDARLIAPALRLEKVEQVLVELNRDRLLLRFLRVDAFPEFVVERRMIRIAACPLLDLFLGQATDALPIGLLLDRAIAAIILAL